VERFCLRADTSQGGGNGNLRASAALVLTLRALGSFPPAHPMLALTARSPSVGDVADAAGALGSAEVHPMQVGHWAVSRVTSC